MALLSTGGQTGVRPGRKRVVSVQTKTHHLGPTMLGPQKKGEGRK